MATIWTEEQKKAITEHGGNILVSAAAGSGKTAVLIERILTIIKSQTDIDKMLIVTFTKAAASELRERLYLSLQKELESDNITPQMAKRLSRQQTLLSKSYITTIDSFCNTVVSSNPEESGIDSSFRIADDGEISVVKAEALEKVLEKRYKENTPEFMHLVEHFGSYKSDRDLEERVLNLHTFAQSEPSPERWLLAQKAAFDVDSISDFSETPWYKELIEELIFSYEVYHDKLYRMYKTCEQNGIEEYEIMLADDVRVLANAIEKLRELSENGTWKDVFEELSHIELKKAPSMGKSAAEKYGDLFEIIEKIKKERQSIKPKIEKDFTKVAGKYPEAPLDDIKAVKSDIEELIDLTLDFSEEYARRKKDKHILTFDDITHSAFNVLSKIDEDGRIVKSDVAKSYSEYFEEVYIDEYQDTNELQDTILRLVSGKEPNMFMVGDVKQSIYGFRQAQPDIFMGKYKKFGKGEQDGKLIVLNKNFRSRESVINSVNDVFEKIMTEKTGGIEYTNNEKLYFGAEYYCKTDSDTSTELYIVQNVKDDDDSPNNENNESRTVAKIIKNLIDSKYQVYDKATEKMRDVTYRDIVILMKSPSGKNNAAKMYQRSMQKLGIPSFFPEKGGFFANAEINILLSFMKIIDNPLQDIHLVATLRNIYGFSDSDLARIKAESMSRDEESFYEMCRNYSKNGKLKDNIEAFLNRLEELRIMAKHLSVSELLWKLIHENHFYEHLILGPAGELHIANVHLLFAKAIQYDRNINKGLFRFLYYFDDLKKRKADMNEANLAADGMNLVRIMSIHKSKGLEFPVVILSETGKQTNLTDLGKPVLLHKSLGIGSTCYLKDDRIKYPTIMKYCVSRKKKNDIIAEDMRVLYVAMTRAAEKLIITGSVSKAPDEYLEAIKDKCSSVTGKPLPHNVLEAKSFLEWITMSGCVDAAHLHLCPVSEDENPADDAEEAVKTASTIPQPAMLFYKDAKKDDEAAMPAKISVSDLKRMYDSQEDDEAAKVYKTNNLHLSSKKSGGLTAAQIGTAVHLCIQLTDYGRIRDMKRDEAAQYVEELILEAQDKGFLSKEQADSIDRGLLTRFYVSDVAKRIAFADEVMREIPFTQLEEIKGEKVAVQGVIDCIIIESGKYTVIDFKTDEVADAGKYKGQLSYYAKAVEKVFGEEPQKMVYFIKHDKQEYL